MKTVLYNINEKYPNVPAKGGNAKGLLLVGRRHDFDTHIELLKNLLKAIHYNYDTDVKMVPLPNEVQSIDWKTIADDNTKEAIIFEVPAQDLGLQINTYLYYWFEISKVRILFSDSLESLSKNKNKKLQLWNALKKQFLEG